MAAGRFAPSPTGPLHLGSLRTALAAWLFARSRAGAFLLRVEDLDPQRSRREWERRQLADLQALGIDWDGPVVRQSERTAAYADAIAGLRAAGLLYECFCTRAELRQAALAPHEDAPADAYPGTCRELSDAERARRRSAGRPAALRLRAGGRRIAFEDLLQGTQTGTVDDFVVQRADGVAAYQLAVVVDDAAQGVDEVVRGADLLASTARQLVLYELLGKGPPRYAHVGLVRGPDGARLAKRHAAATLGDRGEPSAATLTLLARSLGLARDREVTRPQELLAEFDPARVPRGDVRLP